MSKSMIIIGAGMAGLAAGCYGQMNGYQTQIFELHDLPGGLCTSWKRKGYTFDGCIEWLVGSSPATSFYRVWEELGAVQNREMVDHEEFFRIEGKNCQQLIVYCDADRLAQHLIELSPADTGVIKEFIADVKKMSRFQLPIADNFWADLKNLPQWLLFLRYLPKYGRMTIPEYAQRFQDPFLRESFASIFGIPEFSMIALLMALAMKHSRIAGYPIGGSLEFAQAVERRYLSLGGRIYYKSRVAKILTENNQAVGVQLSDGTTHRADLVVSAADGHATIFDLLEGKYLSDELRANFRDLPIFQPLVRVSLGIAKDLSREPHTLTYPLASPITVAGVTRDRLSLKHYCYDHTMAPAGKSALVISFESNYDYWKKLGAGTASYRAEKEKILAAVVAALEQRYPGLAQQIEVTDVATPLTFERYTGNWQGSMEGWLITPKTLSKRIPKTLPGLQNFYMIGQWVQPGGGLPPAAKSGRDLVKKLCRQDGRKFRTIVPA